MKKIWGILCILLCLILVIFALIPNFHALEQTEGSELESPEKQSVMKREFLEDSMEGNSENQECENILAMCPECAQSWDSLLDEMVQAGEDAAGQGDFSLMPLENLSALVESGDPNGMFHYGVNLIWKGTVGFPIFKHESNYKMPSNESIKEHKIDIDMIKQGEKYLFEAAVKGKHRGWAELYAAKSMAFRKMLKDGIKDKKLLREMLAHQLAIANTVKNIYSQDSYILEYYFDGLTDNIELILSDWSFSEQEKLAKEELKSERHFIEELSTSYQQKYFDKWKEARIYIGERIYPKEFPDNFATFYKVAISFCLPNYLR